MSDSIIKVDQVTFQYDLRNKESVLTDISLVVQRGEWLTIIGENGSGKSTLAQLLVGLLIPQSGQIQIGELDLNESTKWDIRKKTGLVFQNPDNQFIGTTVQDDIAFSLENMNMPYGEMKTRVDTALKMVDMKDFRFHDPSRLSGGQKQRVAIAGALALHPDILILDESFVMLDPLSRQHLLEILKRLQIDHQLTIVSITHNMEEAAISDRIMIIENGTVTQAGPPHDIFESKQNLLPPFAEQLRQTLEKKGRQVPRHYMSEDELVNWLCK